MYQFVSVQNMFGVTYIQLLFTGTKGKASYQYVIQFSTVFDKKIFLSKCEIQKKMVKK